jgi:protein-S-isoprenylcysteine O-methyltransferase Ste14
VFAAPDLVRTDPVAADLFTALWAIWIAGELAILVRSLRGRDAQRRDRGSFFVVVGSIFVGLTLGSLLASAVPAAGVQHGSLAVFLIGMLLMAAGIALRFTAVVVLGRFFTPVVMVGGDQHVVEAGPYRWIRHPSYTGSLLTIAGFLLASTNWLALAALVPVVAAFLYRIGVEERALTDALGDAYRSYMRRTKRLVPFLY